MAESSQKCDASIQCCQPTLRVQAIFLFLAHALPTVLFLHPLIILTEISLHWPQNKKRRRATHTQHNLQTQRQSWAPRRQGLYAQCQQLADLRGQQLPILPPGTQLLQPGCQVRRMLPFPCHLSPIELNIKPHSSQAHYIIRFKPSLLMSLINTVN